MLFLWLNDIQEHHAEYMYEIELEGTISFWTDMICYSSLLCWTYWITQLRVLLVL